jgi:hypothetical protein
MPLRRIQNANRNIARAPQRRALIEGGPEGVDPRHGVDLSLRAHDAKGKAAAVREFRIITTYLTGPGRLGTPQSDARLRNHVRRRGRRHP